MTKVKIVKQNNKIKEVECDGHTGYGVYGEDIVCASLSSVVQTALLGLLVVAGINVDVSRLDERGYLKFTISDNLSGDQEIKANAILDTMLCGISDLVEGYSDFIELEVI
ncbi:MAG: ribosomal-processing cysteine protease Prp [Clostridia bacterium]|nr:ribosomal-processing cysteine protease Prp [Clostridia bacterium]